MCVLKPLYVSWMTNKWETDIMFNGRERWEIFSNVSKQIKKDDRSGND